MILLFVTLTFLVVDAYYFTWVMSLKDKLPPEMAAFASDAILGYTKKMSRELLHNLDTEARKKVEDARNKFQKKKDQQRIADDAARDEQKKKADAEKAAAAAAKGNNAPAANGKPAPGAGKPGGAAGAQARGARR